MNIRAMNRGNATRRRGAALCAVSVAMSALLAGCFGIQSKKAAALRGTASQAQQVAPDAGTVGIKNVRQMGLAMASVTGVPFSGEIALQYETISPWLSADGKVESINSSMLLSITGMAGSFCRAMITREAGLAAASRIAHGGIDFTRDPNTVLVSTSGSLTTVTPAAQAVLDNYTRLFWNRSGAAVSAEERQTLQESLLDAVRNSSGMTTSFTGGALNNTEKNKAIFLVPCTAALSSLAFLQN